MRAWQPARMQQFNLRERSTWFAGDGDAEDLYVRLVYVAHAWDDLIDKDKPVDVNEFVANLLLYLPGNPFFRRYEREMRGLFSASFAGYLAANLMEKSGDEHRLEIAHFLRYSVVNVVAFMLTTIHGVTKGAALLSEISTVLIPERLADFMKEHSHADLPQ